MQRFYTAHHPRVNPPRTRFSRRQVAAVADQAEKIDGHQGSYFLMDYCKFGNLEAQLQRAARDMPNGTERYLQDPILWRFFDCLVKACMAMEEPPRLNPAHGEVPRPTQGGYMAEVLTAGNPGREGIVHFDLVSLSLCPHPIFRIQGCPAPPYLINSFCIYSSPSFCSRDCVADRTTLFS